MPESWRAPGSWRVEIVVLSNTPDKHDGQWIRVTRYGSWVADLGSVAELERFFPLAELEEDDLIRAAAA